MGSPFRLYFCYACEKENYRLYIENAEEMLEVAQLNYYRLKAVGLASD
jgi:hypothetical protein